MSATYCVVILPGGVAQHFLRKPAGEVLIGDLWRRPAFSVEIESITDICDDPAQEPTHVRIGGRVCKKNGDRSYFRSWTLPSNQEVEVWA